MKGYRARYTTDAAERIRKLHPQVKREIREGVRELLVSPLAGRLLQFELAGLRSYRVRTYRIIQETPLDVIINVVPEESYSEKDENLILDLFARHLGRRTKIVIERVSHIDLPPSGKSVFVINRCLSLPVQP